VKKILHILLGVLDHLNFDNLKMDGYLITFKDKIRGKGQILATWVRGDEWGIEIKCTNIKVTNLLTSRLLKELLPKRLQR
jgi:hypothetical protein